ncbi:MAG: hypothetical protein IT557_09520 [Alphaproteobacteria bacterium]|nr:hypothetical protein [Alphaproteobacteria bacterium]
MPAIAAPATDDAARRLIALAGARPWRARMASLRARAEIQPRAGRVLLLRHAAELALDRLARRGGSPAPGAERALATHAAALVALHGRLSAAGKRRLRERLAGALSGEGTLVPLLHLVRTAALEEARGFAVRFSGLEEGTPHDLVIARDGAEAELVCEPVSADEGHALPRGDWFSLVDRVDPALQSWLAAHPGRYLLKLTLPEGIAPETGLGDLHRRITRMLAEEKRADQSDSAVLRLDPLLLAAAQAPSADALLARLRTQFGPEAHLAVTAAGAGDAGSVFVMAARAGRENDVPAAVLRRLPPLAGRLSGTRPGILALFLEDTDRGEWQSLRDRLEIETAARQFLNGADGRAVIAVSVATRLELFGLTVPEAAPEGELRFRNPAHPQARSAALAPAVSSLV